MNRQGRAFLGLNVGLACLLLVAIGPTPAEAHGSHPGRATRVRECTQSSSAQTGRIAKHVAGYARDVRWRLNDFVTQADNQRVTVELFRLLRWKLGGAVAVCAQYVSTGYSHFEKSYADEAAALYLGVISFSRQQPEIVVPTWMLDILKWQLETDEAILKYWSVIFPANLAVRVGQAVLAALENNISGKVTAYIPKGYDVDNRLVEAAIKAKRDAQQLASQGTPVTRRGGGRAPSRQVRIQRKSSLQPEHALKSLGKDLTALKAQVTKSRAKIKSHQGAPSSGGRSETIRRNVAWADGCCNRNIRALRTLAGSLSRTANNLQLTYKKANHRQGIRFSGQMVANVRRLTQGSNAFAGARDARSARTALSSISNIVKLLEQNVAKLDDCCDIVSPPTTARPAAAPAPGRTTTQSAGPTAPTRTQKTARGPRRVTVPQFSPPQSSAMSLELRSLPDLVPFISRHQGSCAESNCYQCPRITLLLGVKNVAAFAAMGTITVQVYHRQEGSLVASWTVNGVAGGATVIVGEVEFFPWNCGGGYYQGPTSHRVVIDAGNSVAERNEDNNAGGLGLRHDPHPTFRAR